jgi:hypothetical protein
VNDQGQKEAIACHYRGSEDISFHAMQKTEMVPSDIYETVNRLKSRKPKPSFPQIYDL